MTIENKKAPAKEVPARGLASKIEVKPAAPVAKKDTTPVNIETKTESSTEPVSAQAQ